MESRYALERPGDYESVLAAAESDLFFHSPAYHNHLLSVVDAETRYLIAYDDDDPVGALPAFIQRNDRYGDVLNSLPFYGSHGGVLTVAKLDDVECRATERTLLSALTDLARQEDCVLSTVIQPFEASAEAYEEALEPDYRDVRIGQVKTLPKNADEESLIYDVTKRCRTAIRKARKKGVSISRASSDPMVRKRLIKEHQAHMTVVGGTPKPDAFFNHLEQFYEPDEDFRIYLAEYEGGVAGIMLVFYYEEWVEYYTPVTVPKYRDVYPMNLLIFTGMRDAIREGRRRWNFGGTWTSQDGVYNFKRSFIPVDVRYRYFVNAYKGASTVLSATPEDLRVEYPWFYVVPYEELG